MAISKPKKEIVKCTNCNKKFVLEKKVYALKIEARDTLTYNCPYCNQEYSAKSAGDWEVIGTHKID